MKPRDLPDDDATPLDRLAALEAEVRILKERVHQLTKGRTELKPKPPRLRVLEMPDGRYLLMLDRVGRAEAPQWKESISDWAAGLKDEICMGCSVFSEEIELWVA